MKKAPYLFACISLLSLGFENSSLARSCPSDGQRCSQEGASYTCPCAPNSPPDLRGAVLLECEKDEDSGKLAWKIRGYGQCD